VQQRKIHALRRQLVRLEQRLLRLDTVSRLYARGRAGMVLLGLSTVLIVERFGGTVLGLLAAGILLAGFLGVVACHNRVKTRILRYTIWRHLKATHIARMLRDWAHIAHSAPAFAEPEHVFAADLNLTGERSLLHLLDTTTSHGGHRRLRTWLLQPRLDAAEIRTRQEQVRELVPLAAFRDHLALCGALVAGAPEARWDEASVLAWLHQQTTRPSLVWWVGLLGLLAATNIVLMSLYALSLVPAWWSLSLSLYLILYLYKHGEAHALFVEAYRLEQALEHLRAVLLYLENHKYSGTPHLAKLCAPFWRTAQRPSVALRQIIRIAGAAGVQQSNLLGFLVNALGPVLRPSSQPV
jgi:hypothetical protein